MKGLGVGADLAVVDGDPLEKAPDNLAEARKILEKNKLPLTDENVFLVLSMMQPGKKEEANEGLLLLQGKARVNLPLKAKDAPPAATAPAPAAAPSAYAMPNGPVACSVQEADGAIRTFLVTLDFPGSRGGSGGGSAAATATAPAPAAAPAATGQTVAIKAPFPGSVTLKDLLVKAGASVKTGQVVAVVEAMKADHDVKSPVDGTVQTVHFAIGSEVPAGRPILSLVK